MEKQEYRLEPIFHDIFLFSDPENYCLLTERKMFQAFKTWEHSMDRDRALSMYLKSEVSDSYMSESFIYITIDIDHPICQWLLIKSGANLPMASSTRQQYNIVTLINPLIFLCNIVTMHKIKDPPN